MDWIGDLGLEPQWLWLLGAVLLAIGEMFLPGVFLVWLASAAALTGIVTAFTGIALAMQLLLFAILSAVAVGVGRYWYVSNPVETSDPLLNDRAGRLIGQTVTVVVPLAHGRGRVRVGDGVWSAAGPDLAEGAVARVVDVREGVLILEALPLLAE